VPQLTSERIEADPSIAVVEPQKSNAKNVRAV
jgi:hypothetical protein